MCVYPFGQRSLWLAYGNFPLSPSSFYIGNPNICKHKKNTQKKMAHVIAKQGKKNKTKKIKNKNTKTKIKCVGGTNLLYLLCLIANTMPQLEQSSLQPSTDLHHRHLLQTTTYNHLLLHLLISRKGKHNQQQAKSLLVWDAYQRAVNTGSDGHIMEFWY